MPVPVILGRALWCSSSALGGLQDFFGRLTDSKSISRSSYEGNDRSAVPNLVSEERDYVVDIHVDGLPMFVGALDPSPHGRASLRWLLRAVPARAFPPLYWRLNGAVSVTTAQIYL